jgi:hypothetical protein
MTNRRQNRRWPRRVEVRFWRPEQPEHVYHGVTSDVSETGAFIVTGTPMGTNTRIRVELLTEQGAFVSEAVVRRALHVHRELQSVKTSGMGVRFLEITELIHDILPHAEAVEDERNDDAAVEDDLYAERTLSAESLLAAATGGLADSAPAANAPSSAAVAARPQLRELPVRFRGVEDLTQIYERDLQHGGLFVATASPPPAGTRIRLALYLPGSTTPVLADAQVVHAYEPGATPAPGRNLLTGMGVLFEDPASVLAHVRPLVTRSGSLPKSGG